MKELCLGRAPAALEWLVLVRPKQSPLDAFVLLGAQFGCSLPEIATDCRWKTMKVVGGSLC